MDIRCPHCGAEYDVDQCELGRRAECELCGNKFVIGATIPVVRSSPALRRIGPSPRRVENKKQTIDWEKIGTKVDAIWKAGGKEILYVLGGIIILLLIIYLIHLIPDDIWYGILGIAIFAIGGIEMIREMIKREQTKHKEQGDSKVIIVKNIVKNKEGCFLQTMNCGCGCIWMVIIVIVLLVIAVGVEASN